jgi:hypothetical protein
MLADIDECAPDNNTSVVFVCDELADLYLGTLHMQYFVVPSKAVFPKRRAGARYRALASIIPGRERFFWNLSF